MIAMIALVGLAAAGLVFWALATAGREPNVADLPDRRTHHEVILSSAARSAALSTQN